MIDEGTGPMCLEGIHLMHHDQLLHHLPSDSGFLGLSLPDSKTGKELHGHVNSQRCLKTDMETYISVATSTSMHLVQSILRIVSRHENENKKFLGENNFAPEISKKRLTTAINPKTSLFRLICTTEDYPKMLCNVYLIRWKKYINISRIAMESSIL